MKLKDLKNLDALALLEFFGAAKEKLSIAERFISIGLPSKKLEEYAYADIESYLDMPIEILRPDEKKPQEDEKLIITDGVVTHVPASIKIEVVTSHDADSDHFDPLYYLSHISSRSVSKITIDTPTRLHILHRYTKPESLVSYRVAIEVAPNTNLDLYESFEGETASGTLVLNGFDVTLKKHATINMVKNQTISDASYRTLSTHSLNLQDESRADFSTFDYGDASSLQTLLVKLGERAHIQASHLLYANNNAKRGTISKILHIGEHSTSSQLSKNILDDKARGIFDALIKVENSAKHTKAHQNSKAILLKNGAYMASKPQLEIYIDELEASHGSTIGQLDKKELFYLKSRGISDIEANKMLIQAFANEVIKIVKDEHMQAWVHADFEKVYYGQVQMECLETCHGCDDLIVKEK